MLGKEEHYRDEEELACRTMWFPCVVTQQLDRIMPSLEFRQHLNEEKTERHVQETIVYLSHVMLEQLADDLTERHGWGDEELDVCESCSWFLATNFDRLLGYKNRNTKVFFPLFRKYWTPDDYSTEAYDAFWGIPNDEEPDSLEEAYQQLQDCINESVEEVERKYNIHRLYTFRVSTIYNIPDPLRHLTMWRARCSEFVLPLYKKMFVDLSHRKIIEELRHDWPSWAT